MMLHVTSKALTPVYMQFRIVVIFYCHYSHTPLQQHKWWTQKEQVCLLAAVLIDLRLMHNDFIWLYSTRFRCNRNVISLLSLSSCRFWMRVKNRDGWQRSCVFLRNADAFFPSIVHLRIMLHSLCYQNYRKYELSSRKLDVNGLSSRIYRVWAGHKL